MITVKEIMIAVIVAGIVAAAMWFYRQGEKADELKDAKAANVQLTTALKRVHDLEEQVRQQEHDHSVEVANIDQQHQKDLSNARAQSSQFIDDVMSGKLRLYDPHARCGRPGGDTGQTAGSSSVDHGGEGAELSEETERFLELEAARADEVVIQLTACQAILKDDRATGNSTRK